MSKKKIWSAVDVEKLNYLRLDKKLSWEEIASNFTDITPNGARKAFYRYMRTDAKPKTGPKILLIDVETSPLVSYTWGLFDQNVGLNQVVSDWNILSFSAKWFGTDSEEIMYMDQRNAKDISDDSNLLKVLWSLMDEADVIVGQNLDRFDIKKINARFIINGMKPPSSYKTIDTYKIARKKFGFTSNKLEYMSKKLCQEFKKLDHSKFSGFELWRQCLAGNIDAWKEMELYNKMDVLALEELYNILIPWDTSVSFDVYSDDFINRCTCGNNEFKESGFHYTKKGKFQRYKCIVCGKEHKDSTNLLSKEKRKSIRV